MILFKDELKDGYLRGEVTINYFAELYHHDEILYYASVSGALIIWDEKHRCELNADYRLRQGEWAMSDFGLVVDRTVETGSWGHHFDSLMDERTEQDAAMEEQVRVIVQRHATPKTMEQMRKNILKGVIESYEQRLNSLHEEEMNITGKVIRYRDMLYGI